MSQRRATIVLGCSAAALILVSLVSLGVAIFGATLFGDQLHPNADFVDVARSEVVAAGYRVPESATRVHIKDRALQDVRATWVRFEVPESEIEALEAQVAAQEDRKATVWSGALPEMWPRMDTLGGFETPGWWAPGEGARAYVGESVGRGAITLFERGRVHNLLWTYEGWRP